MLNLNLIPKKTGLNRLIFGSILFISNISFAAITIDINNGINKPYPIAKLSFEKNISNNNLESIIESDLQKSGKFVFVSNKINKNLYVSKPDKMPWSKLANVANSADFILQGNIDNNINNNINNNKSSSNIEYALFNSQSHKLLKGQSFKNIKPTQVRALAHYISDQIYNSVTGLKGYFSSKIAYVLVKRNTKTKKIKNKLLYQLIVADSDGYNPHVLVEQTHYPLATPQFSPDGKSIAYVSYVKNRMAVYTISLKTGKRILIANFPGINSAPSFSPDGKFIAMSLSKGDRSDTNLYLYNISTKKFTRLTSAYTNTSPVFSQDGKNILFTSNRSGKVQVYQIKLSSKKIERITDFGVQNFDARYLPVSKLGKQKIVLMSQIDSGGGIRVSVMDLNDRYGDSIRFISNGPLDKSPVASSNGQMVLYVNLDSRHGSLKVVSVNGQTKFGLHNDNGIVRSPAWSY